MPILPPIAAYLIILAIALALYALGMRVAKRASLPGRVVLLLLGVVLSLPALIYTIYYLNLYDDASWLLSLRSAPLAEYYAAGLGLLIGCLTAWLPGSRLARLLKHGSLIPFLVFWLIVPFLKPLLTPLSLFTMKNEWHDGVCMQTTPSTCGPASAATLLHAQGLQVTEAQLAHLSWTSLTGTENWYLARALRSLGCRVRYVQTAENPDPIPYPSIAGVRMGGPHGPGHFIAIIGKENERYVVGDPAAGAGKMMMPPYDHPYYYFTGMFMVVERR